MRSDAQSAAPAPLRSMAQISNKGRGQLSADANSAATIWRPAGLIQYVSDQRPDITTGSANPGPLEHCELEACTGRRRCRRHGRYVFEFKFGATASRPRRCGRRLTTAVERQGLASLAGSSGTSRDLTAPERLIASSNTTHDAHVGTGASRPARRFQKQVRDVQFLTDGFVRQHERHHRPTLSSLGSERAGTS